MSTATKPPPHRTHEERMDALHKANGVRHERSVLKRDLKRKRRGPEEVLTTVPGYAETMKLVDLLLALPRIGRVTANNLCDQLHIRPNKYLSSLSKRQREELLGVIRRLR